MTNLEELTDKLMQYGIFFRESASTLSRNGGSFEMTAVNADRLGTVMLQAAAALRSRAAKEMES